MRFAPFELALNWFVFILLCWLAPGICILIQGGVTYYCLSPWLFWIVWILFHLVWSLSTHYFESRQENQESQHLQHQLRLQQQPPQPVQQQHEELDQHDRQLHDSPVKAPGETIKDLAPDYNEAIVGHNSRQESPPPSYERLVFQM